MLEFQKQFNFGKPALEEGYTKSVQARKIAAHELALHMNIPLGHQVEVWLAGGVRLRGKLRLKTEQSFVKEGCERHLELAIVQVVFTFRELESCVRLD